MDMDNGVGIDRGSGGQVGGGRQRGKNWDNCNSISNKVLKEKKNREVLE